MPPKTQPRALPLLPLAALILAAHVLAAPAPDAAGQPAPLKPAGRQPDAEWAPWHVPCRIAPHSPLDVSRLLDAPAGKHGPTRPAPDGALQFADGTRARFWGVNLAWEAQFPAAEQIPPIVARLAANGVNMIRLTYMDNIKPKGPLARLTPTETVLDPEYIDRLDRFAAALIHAGIHIDLSLVMGGTIDELGMPKAGQKAIQIFHPQVIAAHDRFIRTLLAHKNPYTGKTWATENAIALIEIYNEGDIFYLRKHLDKTTPEQRAPLDAKWRAWIQKEKPNLPPEETAHFDIAIMDAKEEKKRPLRTAAIRFLVELHQARYAHLRAIIRQAGYRGAICDNAGGSFSPASRYAQRKAEILVAHNYFDHPPTGKSAITTRLSAAKMRFPFLRASAAERLPEKPILLGEWDCCWPNPWRAEGVAATAAFAAFQNWTGALQFTYSSKPWDEQEKMFSPEGHIPGIWRVMNDPAVMAQYPAAALLFLRGDIDTHRQKIVRRQNAWQTGWPPADMRAFIHGILVDVAPDATDAPSPKPGELPPLLQTDTGQIDYLPEPGILRIDSPRTQGIVGHPGKAEWKTTDAALRIDTPFAVVLLTSLTDAPIAQTQRMLLTAVAQAENTGFAFTEKPNDGKAWIPASRGGPPILVQIVKGNLQLRRKDPLRVHALAPDGTRAAPVEAAPMPDESWTIPLGAAGPALHYEIEITN